MDNLNNFKQVMAMLAVNYDKEIKTELIGIYWELLGGYKPEHLAQAAKDHMADENEGRFFPKPANLIGHINKLLAKDRASQKIELYLENHSKPKELSDKTKGQKAVKQMLKELRA